ncbi:MAG: DUF4091 domain-containing protein [Clostridia bacterium]|nr:DUF4091 domain-containing protein [Clostridia bacterium]
MILTLTDSLEKVFKNSGPKRTLRSFSVLKAQRYNMQLCIFNPDWLKTGVHIRIEGALAPYCSTRVVEEISAGQTNYQTKDDYYIFEEDSARSYPDLLRPIEEGDLLIGGKLWTTLWITLDTPKEIQAGREVLRFTLFGEQGDIASSEVEVEVIDAILPSSDLHFTNWMHYDSIADYYGVEPWSDRYYEILGTYLDSAINHGVNMVYVPLFTPPLDTQIGGERTEVQLVDISVNDDGEYHFDFGRLDEFVDFCRSRGVGRYEMCHLTTQWGAKACPKIMATTPYGYEKIFGWDTSSTSEEYCRFLEEFLPRLDSYLVEKGIDRKVYFHISDEPSEEQWQQYSKVASFVKGLLKGYQVIDASSTTSNPYVDIPVLSTTHIGEDVPEGIWAYYCCTASDNYLSNRFFGMPSLRNRILGMQLYETGIEGFLHWGFNFYNTAFSLRRINPFVTSDAGGAFPSGDSFVVYPGVNGAMDSLRLEVLYEGIEDRMSLKMLESMIGRERVLEILHSEGVRGLREYPHSEEWLLSFRDKVNALIKQNLN